MSPRLEIAGKRFGMLVAIEEMPKRNGMRVWRLKCDCGGERTTLQKDFASGGKMRSCGCANRPFRTHGLTNTPEYRHWVNMVSRCETPSSTGFAHYGGRGIKVCERWRSNFQHFYEDMGPRPAAGYSVDRIDVNGHYEPGNCRWATQTEQSRNTRVNHLVSVDGQTLTLAGAAENAPVPYNTVLYRLKRGWSPEDAVTLSARRGRRP